ncbi:hypothetical protein [Comamonas sp. JUb58]|uniref:hypothetical protein n=1 Tax=Comamonas sp. JUb58 TaxID=2485114 RepID=UPI00105CFA7B|nr:hypothetical protein [Comamonas sp. JUb58]
MTIKFSIEEQDIINYIKNSSYKGACLSSESASKYLKEEDLKDVQSFSWKPIKWKNETVKLYKLINLVAFTIEEKAELKDFEKDGINFLDDEYKDKLEFAFSCFVFIKNLRDKEYLEQEIKKSIPKQKTKILKF